MKGGRRSAAGHTREEGKNERTKEVNLEEDEEPGNVGRDGRESRKERRKDGRKEGRGKKGTGFIFSLAAAVPRTVISNREFGPSRDIARGSAAVGRRRRQGLLAIRDGGLIGLFSQPAAVCVTQYGESDSRSAGSCHGPIFDAVSQR